MTENIDAEVDELGLDWVYCADYPRDAAMDIYKLRNVLKEGFDALTETT